MSTFQVTLFDLSGHTITIPSTPDMLVSTLIEHFRKVSPNNSKNKKIILTGEKGPLKKRTLGENGIHGEITLMAIYGSYGENIACINPEPIAPYLHEWIECRDITFPEPLQAVDRYKTYHSNDCTNILAPHNGWKKGKEYLFFVTDTPQHPLDPVSFPSDLLNKDGKETDGKETDGKETDGKKTDGDIWYESYIGRIVDHFPLDIMLYPHGLPNGMGEDVPHGIGADVPHGIGEDVPNGMGADVLYEQKRLPNFSSVRGTLDAITLHLTTRKRANVVFRYKFMVMLRGPIEIRDPQGTLLRSLDADARCSIKYDHIVMCDHMEQPVLPQGGKRSTRSKRSKRSTRSKRSKAKKTRTKKRL
jgi:hypothetical protein